MTNEQILSAVKGGLIVSCQALEDEPLYGGDTMAKMARAAFLGGASGIRANSVEDISQIKRAVELPVIGIIKKAYPGSGVYITPTIREVDALCECGVDIIALDATDRVRPGGLTLSEFFQSVRKKYPEQLFMADTSCFEEGRLAEALGFDLVGTTLSGYTEYTRGTELPDVGLMKRYAHELNVPVIAEGGIWTPGQLGEIMRLGVHAAVVGTAITRPMEITKRFSAAIINSEL